MRCDLQIFSGCVCHLEQLHAQSPFLFPIVFSINLFIFVIVLRMHTETQSIVLLLAILRNETEDAKKRGILNVPRVCPDFSSSGDVCWLLASEEAVVELTVGMTLSASVELLRRLVSGEETGGSDLAEETGLLCDSEENFGWEYSATELPS